MTNCCLTFRRKSTPAVRMENSFVYAAPIFRRDIRVTLGEVVTRDRFVFADLKAALSQNGVVSVAGV
jgi:hypothetical protein